MRQGFVLFTIKHWLSAGLTGRPYGKGYNEKHNKESELQSTPNYHIYQSVPSQIFFFGARKKERIKMHL